MGKFIKIAIVGVILLGILMVFSTPGIRKMEDWARERPDTSIGQSLPYTLGAIAYYTFRYDLSKDIYETNMATWPDNPANADAAFRIAMCLEKLGQYQAAVAAFEDFAVRYADDKRVDAAISRAGKIKAVQLDQPFN